MHGRRMMAVLPMMILAACAPTAPPLPPSPDLAAEEKSLREAEMKWSQELTSKDLDKQMAHYASDAVLMAPGMSAMKGADAIRSGMKEMFADPKMQLEFTTSKVDISKDATMATTQGAYKMAMTDPKTKKVVHDVGGYSTTYRKQDGKWLAVVDIATSGPPAAAK